MKKIILKIEGMTCSACSSGLEKYLNKQKGIIEANVNLVMAIATITYEDIKIKDIEKYIKEAGFKSGGEFKDFNTLDQNKSKKKSLIIFGILLLLLMYISMAHMFGGWELEIISHKSNPINYGIVLILFTIAFLWYGFDIIKSGVKNLIHKMPNMDTLVTLGVLSSFLYSIYGFINICIGNLEYLMNLYFESACMIIYFIKLGRYIENISKDKTKDAIKELVQITPKNAIIKKEGKEISVNIDEVNIGDIVVCKPGEKIAVDGTIIEGKTHIDESFITGESKPVLKETGSKVIAGSINYDGVIEYKAEKIGKNSTISEIVKLVVEATNTKNKIQKIADKVSSLFVPILVGIALITFIAYLIIGYPFGEAINTFVTILVVACPCALGLAVPLVVVVGNGLCAKKGIFVRNSQALEVAKGIDTVVLDKTGTLTYGKLKIYKAYNYSNISDKELLEIASSLEAKSTHPIATAFKSNNSKKVEEFKNIEGIGIQGKIDNNSYYIGSKKMLEKLKIEDTHNNDYNNLVNSACSIMYIIKNNEVIGLIGIKDTIRDNVKEFIKKLKDRNITPIMLTGDNEKTAQIIANEIGIENVISEVMPKNKSEEIEKLLKQNKKVMMVGDGINDAPALVKSTVGISINDGTDIAMDSADVILMNNNLNNILDFIDISKKSYKIIKENLFWAFFYNLCMIPIAMGLLRSIGITMNPMFGSIAMTFSSLTVVANSLRLKRKINKN